MYRSIFASFSLITLALLPQACGGPQPPANSSAEATQAPAAATPASESKSATAQAEDAKPTETAVAPEEEKKAGPSPKELLTREGVMYSFAFRSSDAYTKAQAACEKESGTDQKAIAGCMAKARASIIKDAMVFRKGDDGNFWWYTIQQKGAKMETLSKVQVEFGEEKDGKITVKAVGKSQGKVPAPKELSVEVPNEAEIFVADEAAGKMVYEVKMGVLDKL